MRRNLSLALVLAFMFLLFFGCSGNEKVMDLKTAKETLIRNTEYVRQNILGTWSTADGIIVEYYSNGITVTYKPVRTVVVVNDVSSITTPELQSIGYSGYIIPEPDSYTDEELQSYGRYIQNTDKVGIAIRTDFFGTLEDKHILHEFPSKDTLIMGGITLTRIKNGEPEITDDITGLYMNEQDKALYLSVIRIKEEATGHFKWSGREGGFDGECGIESGKVVLDASVSDFVFLRQGTDLIEVGSDGFPGSHLSYKKVSSLAYISQSNDTLMFDNSGRAVTDYDLTQSEAEANDYP